MYALIKHKISYEAETKPSPPQNDEAQATTLTVCAGQVLFSSAQLPFICTSILGTLSLR